MKILKFDAHYSGKGTYHRLYIEICFWNYCRIIFVPCVQDNNQKQDCRYFGNSIYIIDIYN